MKKHILVTIALLLSLVYTRSTAQDSKGFIGISGGYSMLSGNIIKSEYSDLSSGFAKSGSSVFSLDGAYFFNKNIGIGAILSSAQFGVKDQDKLASGYVDAFAVDEVTLTVGSYNALNIFPAFYYTLPFEKLNVDFRIMVGYSSLKTPEIKIQLEDNADKVITQKSSSAGGLGYGAGAGVRYSFTKHFGAALRLDYLMSKPDIAVANENISNPTDALRVITKYNESVYGFNSTLGLMYNF